MGTKFGVKVDSAGWRRILFQHNCAKISKCDNFPFLQHKCLALTSPHVNPDSIVGDATDGRNSFRRHIAQKSSLL